MKVFILATCRDEFLLDYSTLVFRTVRVGFPNAEVHVTINQPMRDVTARSVRDVAEAFGCLVTNPEIEYVHGQWIESLVRGQKEPFWICDTDIIFYDSMEDIRPDESIAGARVQEHFCPYINANVRSRLHPSLMRIDPVTLKAQIATAIKPLPHSAFVPLPDLFCPQLSAYHGQLVFQDTMGLLTHMVGGTAFDEPVLNRYFHFFAGTFSTVVPHLNQDVRNAILKTPDLGKGGWREQRRYYEDHPARWCHWKNVSSA